MSREFQKYSYRELARHLVHQALGFAGYFVPASKIADLIPPDFRLWDLQK